MNEEPIVEEILSNVFKEKLPGESLFVIRTDKHGMLQTLAFGEVMPTSVLIGTLELVKSLVTKRAFEEKVEDDTRI